jgi:serine protease Do
MAWAVVDDLIQYRYLPTGWLGVSVDAPSSEAAGLPRGAGVEVTAAEAGSPAESHLKPGDVIGEWNGEAVWGVDDFARRARKLRPDDKVTLEVVRDGDAKKVKLTAAAFPEQMAEAWAGDHLGIEVRESTYQALAPNGIVVTRQGVFVSRVNPGTPAQAIGFQPGDLILRLNRDRIGSVADFRTAVSRYRGRGNVFVQIQRGAFALPATVPFRLSGERW